MRKVLTGFVLVLLMFVLAGCKKDPAIVLSKEEYTLKVGESVKIEYELKNTKETVVWKAEDPKIVKVEDGVVTGLKKGETAVSLQAGSAVGFVTIKVLPKDEDPSPSPKPINIYITVNHMVYHENEYKLYKTEKRFALTETELDGKTYAEDLEGYELLDSDYHFLVHKGDEFTLELKYKKKFEDPVSEIDYIMNKLTEFHNETLTKQNISLLYDKGVNTWTEKYHSVNLYQTGKLSINTEYALTDAQVATHCGNVIDRVEFVTVHDTANIKAGAIGHGKFFRNDSTQVSIHYIVGDEMVLKSAPETNVAYHAGDGTSAFFYWESTGVPAFVNKQPTFDVDPLTENYILNGILSSVHAPRVNGRVATKADLSDLGPTWKIVDGFYFLGISYYNKSFKKIASRGGNNNSIGIETCVNTNGDIIDTWQKNAKLVADILFRHNLDATRVKMHNTFSGKNCPNGLRNHKSDSDNGWDRFIKLVEFELWLLQNAPTAKITFTPEDTTYMKANGRVFGSPALGTNLVYEVKVEYNGKTLTKTFTSTIK